MKKTIIVKIAAAVERIARRGAGQTCKGDWHQPKVPAALRLKK